MTKRKVETLRRLESLGIPWEQCFTLWRAQLTLLRWAEGECGTGNDWASWHIERDEKTGTPYRVTIPNKGTERRERIPDREKGALRRVKAIVEAVPGLTFYHQTDPRGCSLYVGKASDLGGFDPERAYHRLVAVC